MWMFSVTPQNNFNVARGWRLQMPNNNNNYNNYNYYYNYYKNHRAQRAYSRNFCLSLSLPFFLRPYNNIVYNCNKNNNGLSLSFTNHNLLQPVVSCDVPIVRRSFSVLLGSHSKQCWLQQQQQQRSSRNSSSSIQLADWLIDHICKKMLHVPSSYGDKFDVTAAPPLLPLLPSKCVRFVVYLLWPIADMLG